MKKGIAFAMLLFGLLLATTASAQSKTDAKGYTISFTVTEKGTAESIMMASCNLNPLGAFTVTNIDGKASFTNIPQGKYTLEISYVGFEKYQTMLDVNGNQNLKIVMTPTS